MKHLQHFGACCAGGFARKKNITPHIFTFGRWRALERPRGRTQDADRLVPCKAHSVYGGTAAA